ncbi:MAG TPA: DMT family transporter [Pyrinomonadaceae bacterium]|nr:DMT family transporter [Pyrinomonadaceae bacterium]HNU08495.1 DMT family transporter [Pyrinomonadaceae bacterium]
MTNAVVSPTLFVVLAVTLWSTGGLLIKITSVSGFEVNLGRCFFAAITIALLTRFRAIKADRFTLLASVFYVGALSFYAVANKYTTAANAIFLQYTAPVYILVFAPFVLKERFRVSDLLTVIVCLGGMTLFFVDSAPASNLSPQSQLIGNILGLCSGVSLGGYILLLRHPRSLNQNPAASVFYGNLFAIAAMVPFVAAAPSSWTGKDVLAVVLLGVFQIGLAYYLFTYGVTHGVRSLDASIIGFIEPLLNPLWVFLFVGERPSAWAIVGGVIIIAGVLFQTLVQNIRKRAVA